MEKSKVYWELREKYITRAIRPYVLIVLAGAVAYICEMIMGIAQLASNTVYYVN
jgi:hypothetical protein